MASLHRRSDSPYWIIAYTDAKGRRLKKSSKCTDYDEALKVSREWEEAVRQARQKRAVDRQQKLVLDEIRQVPVVLPPSIQPGIREKIVPNQREIARRLGLSQATVSMALRGDRAISPDTRRKIGEAAIQLGYHSNAYVSVLMSRIRSGRKMSDQGVIAMLVDSPSEHEWNSIASYRVFHSGALRRGRELGYHVEIFFLRSPGVDSRKVDRILQARGIQGVILAPPYKANRSLRFSWERYSAVAVGFGWAEQDLDRVAFDNQSNFILAFQSLWQLGYRRIGVVLDELFTTGNYSGVKWYTGFLDCQSRLAQRFRIPVCAFPFHENHEHFVSPAFQAIRRRVFEKWFKKWRPDALLTIGGYEHEWLDSMGIAYPGDVGMATLAQPVKPEFAWINERAEEVGAAALEWVASKIARNEYGHPRFPKVMTIEGEWVEGGSVRRQRRI